MKIAKWPVVAVRKCQICGQPYGAEHDVDCSVRARTVVVKVEFDLVLMVRESATPDEIEWLWNETNCRDSIIDRLSELRDRLQSTGHCSCDLGNVKFLREATENDEKVQMLSVKDKQ